MIKRKYLQSGYTLVELLVVIAITVLMLGISMVNYREYGRRDQVKSAAKIVRSFIWDAQGRSLAPRSKDSAAYQIPNLMVNTDPLILQETVVGQPDSNVATLKLPDNIYISKMTVDGSTIIVPAIIRFIVNPSNASQQTEICVGGVCTYSAIALELSSKVTQFKYEVSVNKNVNIVNIKQL